jgi:DNA-binding NarL/FixJ family response regulator
VLKDAQKEDMLRAIRAVGQGEGIFSAGIARRLMDFFSTARPAVPLESFPSLTDREREILHLMVAGAANADIARQLGLSGKTVANYVSTILRKLQVADRAAAIGRAHEVGLG